MFLDSCKILLFDGDAEGADFFHRWRQQFIIKNYARAMPDRGRRLVIFWKVWTRAVFPVILFTFVKVIVYSINLEATIELCIMQNYGFTVEIVT